MQRQNVIVAEKCPNQLQVWGSFKRMCEANELPYHSLKMKKFPFGYKDWSFHKVKFNSNDI